MSEKSAEGRFFKLEVLKNQKSASRPRPMHYHDTFELYFMEKGSCKYFIDNKVYSVTEGDLILIPEGTLHITSYDGDNARTLINCSRHYVPLDATEQLPSLLYLYRNPSLIPTLRGLIDSIRLEYEHSDAFSEQILTGWMHLLFYTLIRESHAREVVRTEHSYISAAIAYVKAHYTEEVTLTKTAAAVSVSPEHLSRIFKKETGLGFAQYLTMLRLQQAEAMLKSNTNARVSEVAFACGFNDSNYFSQRFKERYGLSPNALRKGLNAEYKK